MHRLDRRWVDVQKWKLDDANDYLLFFIVTVVKDVREIWGPSRDFAVNFFILV